MPAPASSASARPPTRPARWRRALGFAFPYRAAVGVIVAITLLLAAINAAEPLVLKFIFDALQQGRGTDALKLGVIGLLGLGLCREACNSSSNWLTWKTRIGLHYQLLEATVERLHRLPLDFHTREGVGAIITKLDRSIQSQGNVNHAISAPE